jgi:hypothetical protein
MGGEFIDSEPGMIRFSLPDPTCPVDTRPMSWFSLLNLGKKTNSVSEHIMVELKLEKKAAVSQSVLQMTVMMKPQEKPHKINDDGWRNCCQSICRDLRAYLMSR